MTPHEINEALALHRGWTHASSNNDFVWADPCGEIYMRPPNYYYKLDEVRSIEQEFMGESESWDDYCRILAEVFADGGKPELIRFNNLIGASAPCRATACVKKLGLWRTE